jgi:hypothetical protein
MQWINDYEPAAPTRSRRLRDLFYLGIGSHLCSVVP